MASNLLTILGGIGATFIVTYSTIFKPIREWITKKNVKIGMFISCPQCVGFWCGLFVYLLNIDIFTIGFIVSFISMIVGRILIKYQI